MRPSHLLRLLALPLISSAFASRLEQPVADLALPKRQLDIPDAGGKFEGDTSTTTDGGAGETTLFNGKRVPKALELSGAELDDTIKDGYWLVEFFSPYCHHCKAFAPTWQTMFEYYYTSDPRSASGDEVEEDFTKYYNFNFAKVDCVSNGDACAAKKISQFPMIVLFKDGETVEKRTGAKSLEAMSTWVEETLESIRPGSRPREPTLPAVGADHVDGYVPEKAPEKANNKGGAAGTKTASAKSTVSATPVSRAKETPNPNGKSVALTAENFQRLVTTTHDPWFIKFYAPWCQHCQALAPNWQGMARQMRGQLNIGEVNCDVEKRLCRDVKVRGYPTILFFRGGERIEYDGLRGLGDLISYANKAVAVGEPVRDVTAAEFEEMEKKEEVIFLYFYDHATVGEDFAALDRLVLSLIGHAKLVKTNDALLAERFKISTWPRLLVSRDGKPTYYIGLAPKDLRDFRKVLNWMQSVWLPIVPELTASNAREIMDGKLVVLGILARDRTEEFESGKREIKNAALEWIDKQTQAFQLERQELRDSKQLRIEEAEDRNDQRALRAAKSIRINMDDIERKEVGFAWVDGVFWERWTRTTFGMSVLSDNEKVVMYEHDNHRYWDNTETGNPIVPSRTSILETLPRVVSNPPRISSKSTTTFLGHAWWVFKGQLFEHPKVSIGVAIGVAIGMGIVVRRNANLLNMEKLNELQQRLPGYFKVGEKGGPLDGLLGGTAPGGPAGKVD